MLILAIFLFSIANASVSANDADDRIIVGKDSTTINISQNNNNLVIEQSNEEKTITEGEVGTFSELQNNINANYGSILKLKKDYEREDDFEPTGIIINQNIILDGQGHKLDSKGLARILYVNASNVIIKNITFVNGNSGHGSAVYWIGDNGQLINCNFTNNTAVKNGGAVYWGDTEYEIYSHSNQSIAKNGTMIGCNFINNHADLGGAVFWFANDGNLKENCYFNNNTAKTGGAVYWKGNLGYISDNCDFFNNIAETYAGAIYWQGNNGTLKNNCRIINNKALCIGADTIQRGGGGIYWNGESGNITNNCTFINNTAKTNDGSEFLASFRGGGAIYLNGLNTNVSYCTFSDNTVAHYGAAIYAYNNNIKIYNCNFTNNVAWNGGAAIGVCGDYSEFYNCNFVNNRITDFSSCGGAIYLKNNVNSVHDCTFINNTAENMGGAVYAYYNINIYNCNFKKNSAYMSAGAIYLCEESMIFNCSFTDNYLFGWNKEGGAIFLKDISYIYNSTFTNNSADRGGAIYLDVGGNVTNCNFTDNTATGNGGALYFKKNFIVTNSTFTRNNADKGSAIFILESSYTKNINHSCFLNNRANVKDLDAVKNENNLTINFKGQNNFINAIYAPDNITFNNVTYWGVNGITNTDISIPIRSNNASGQNITVIICIDDVIVKNEVLITDENGTIVLNMDVGDNYLIIVRHNNDSYYNGAEKIISKNIGLYAYVSSIASNNRTVNITAKSNILNNIIQGKLSFILSDGSVINANYCTNGTWWAVHTFEDFKVYKINASYDKLNISTNNATITLTKSNSTISINNITLNYNETLNVTVTTNGATGISAKIDNINISVVNNYTIPISNLNAGNHTLTVTTIADYDHNPVSREVNITVNRVDSTLMVDNIVFEYNGTGFVNVSFTGAVGVNASVVGQSGDVVKINGTIITVSGLDVGNYTLTVTTIADYNHNPTTKNATIIVNKIQTEFSGNTITTIYNVNKDLIVTLKDSKGNILNGTDVIVDLNGVKNYTTDNNGQIKVSTYGLTPKIYYAKLTFNGNNIYAPSVKNIKITINKAKPIIIAKKKTYKAKTKTKKFKITIKDNIGKPIKKANVKLSIKKITKKDKKKRKKSKKHSPNIVKTNKKGKATFKINKNKKGKYWAIIKCLKNNYYTKITKKVKITIK